MNGPPDCPICAAVVARMEALAAEAEAGEDHTTAARIRTALYDEEESA